MCESTVYLQRDGGRELVMENVTLITVEGDSVKLTGIFGQSKALKGKVLRIDSDKHEVLIG